MNLDRDDLRQMFRDLPAAALVVVALWLALALIFAIVPGP
jgi:hypothetical protein